MTAVPSRIRLSHRNIESLWRSLFETTRSCVMVAACHGFSKRSRVCRNRELNPPFKARTIPTRNRPNVSTSGTPERRRIVDPRYSSSSGSSLMMSTSRA